MTPETPQEDVLLEALRRGHDAAFAILVRMHGGRMLATARRLLRNEEEAKDAVQDALISAARAIDSFAEGCKVSTWLHRIVVNTALMKLRSRRRRAETSIDELLPRFEEDGHRVAATVGWDAASDVLLERQETRVMVRRCIEQLPESYRVVLMLRDIEDVDTDEAAQALGISANAVKIRLHRARQALRALIEREVTSGRRDATERLIA